VAFYYLIQYLMHRIVVPGYASIIIAVLVLGGVQLLALGVMGEYLGRLHLNVNRKPQYVERHVVRATEDEADTLAIALAPEPEVLHEPASDRGSA
jgi:undecaprenyl-phosphate 4-deoxy-4-formamido-L-arabinose transferase